MKKLILAIIIIVQTSNPGLSSHYNSVLDGKELICLPEVPPDSSSAIENYKIFGLLFGNTEVTFYHLKGCHEALPSKYCGRTIGDHYFLSQKLFEISTSLRSIEFNGMSLDRKTLTFRIPNNSVNIFQCEFTDLVDYQMEKLIQEFQDDYDQKLLNSKDTKI